MIKVPVTLIILTLDEELNLEYCLRSAAGWVEQIVVVDSGSTDGTIAIAKKYGAEIYEHKFKNQADQFNWALDHVKLRGEWIMRLDADEMVPKQLWEEIAAALPQAPAGVSGFYLCRRVYFRGRWIRHGGYYPTWLLRLFRKGAARSEEREMDEHIVLATGRALHLQNDFKDENHKDLAWWKAKHRSYALREARAMFGARHSTAGKAPPDLLAGQPERRRWLKENLYWRLPIFVRPFLYFFYRYFLRAGFLDGATGLRFHLLQGLWYRLLVDREYSALVKKARGAN